jgi:RNA 2',3'-cyclic 3'-phosphodiesterase
LWAGVGKGSEQLRSLAADLDAAFAHLGFERERRPYTPHLTIGRVRGKPANLDLPTFTGNFEFKVGDVELVESMLPPEGAVYEILDTFALGESSRRVQP